jgi:hypothetical protein
VALKVQDRVSPSLLDVRLQFVEGREQRGGIADASEYNWHSEVPCRDVIFLILPESSAGLPVIVGE